MRTMTFMLCLALAASAGVGIAADGTDPDVTVFDPQPLSEPLYGVQYSDADPDRQQHYVRAIDGVRLFVETHLPVEKDGNVPPERVPVILIVTPYANLDGDGVVPNEESGRRGPIEWFVSRGYALSIAHLRGTASSGGCITHYDELQVDDTARVIEYLGRDAPWSDGNVGMYGISYDAETQALVAGRGDPERIQYLKAIIPVEAGLSMYDFRAFDGVPFTIGGSDVIYTYATYPLIPSIQLNLEHYAERLGCQPVHFEAFLDTSGDYAPYWQVRENRTAAPQIQAATLLVYGFADFATPDPTPGFFDRIAEETPHKGLFGQWSHEFPDEGLFRPELARLDWLDMVTAWYDRYLKGLPTGVEDWPDVQVQGTDGQWRVEPDWPTTGGPVGQLALGSGGVLGASSPEGATSYAEPLSPLGDDLGSSAVFTTGPLPDRLELTGQPVVDLWVVLDQPDAHVVAELDAFDAEGNLVDPGFTWGLRSMRHLDPVTNGHFAQTEGRPAPVGEPIRVEVRMSPRDIVIPAGGWLRLRLTGVLDSRRARSLLPGEANDQNLSVRPSSLPSGAGTNVTILHDCTHPSALRFLMPRENPQRLEVRDVRTTEGAPPIVSSSTSDGGGIATADVCGQAPLRPATLGPVR